MDKISSLFTELAHQYDDHGASLYVFYKGRTIADISYSKGLILTAEEAPIVNMFSVSKMILASIVGDYISTGRLSANSLVSDHINVSSSYRASVYELLHHQGGLVAFEQSVGNEELYHFDRMVSKLSNALPQWVPGTMGYGPFIWGWLVGALIESVDGRPLELILEEKAPHVFFGKRTLQQPAIADLKGLKSLPSHMSSTPLVQLMGRAGQEATKKAFLNPLSQMIKTNSSDWRSALIPAANGHANAYGLAMFLRNVLYSPSLKELLMNSDERGMCHTLYSPQRVSYGFMRPQGLTATQYGSVHSGFGHSGAGGSFGFVDYDRELVMSYVTPNMGQSIFMDIRGSLLSSAVLSECNI